MATEIHELALEAEKSTEQLATAIAQAGASEQIVAQITQAAELLRTIVQALGRGQEETGDNEPAGEGGLGQAAAETHQAMQAAAAQRNA